jgi:hypothetical protein
MKKAVSRVLVAALLVGMATFAVAAEMGSWTGWITDSHCAAKGASASHADCATKCVKDKGASWQFINSADKSVWSLSDQAAAGKMVGKEVTVKGTADASAKTITVSSIEDAKK